MKMIFALIVCSFIMVSCIGVTGSGRKIKESRTVSNFTGLSVSQSIDVTVRIGNTQSLQIEADDNIIASIETNVIDGVLEISYTDEFSINNANAKVEVVVPYLDIIKVSSSASVFIKDRMRFDGKLRIQSSSSGEVEADIIAKELIAEANSSSNIKLSGIATNGDFAASSSGDIDAKNLVCETAVAAASSSGFISLNVSKNLNASVSSSGEVRYTGSAIVAKSVSSSGSVEKL